VGPDRGGCGKTELVIQLALACQLEGIKVNLAEVDTSNRLSNLLGKDCMMESLKASANIRDQLKDKDAVVDFLAPLVSVWSTDRSITDFGANVSSYGWQWIDEMGLVDYMAAKNIRPRYAAVATADIQTMTSAAEFLLNAMARFGAGTAPDGKGALGEFFLVSNDLLGDGGAAEHFKGKKVWNDLINAGVQVIHIPHINSKLMAWGRANGLTVNACYDMGDELWHIFDKGREPTDPKMIEMMSEVGLDEHKGNPLRYPQRQAKLGRMNAALLTWMRQTKENLLPLYTFPGSVNDNAEATTEAA